MKSNSKTSTISSYLQITLFATAVLFYCTQAAFSVWLLIDVYSDGFKVSPFLVVSLQALILPPLLFMLAYLTSPRPASRSWRAAESIVLAISAAMIIGLLETAWSELLQQYFPMNGLATASMYQLLPSIVGLCIYVFLLISYRHTRKPHLIDPGLQRLFIGLIFTAMLAQWSVVFYRILQQYPNNTNLSGFYPYLVSALVIPILFFAVAYATKRNEATIINRLFASSILVTIGLMIYGMLNIVVSQLYGTVIGTSGIGTFWSWRALELVAVLVALAIYIVIVRSEKKSQGNK